MTCETINLIEPVKIISILRSLGLTKYETIMYLALIRNGPQDCKSLTHITGIPSGKIYTVMKNLMRKDWIWVSANERPKILYALDPKMAIKKRINELKEALNLLEVKANRLSSIIKISLNNFCPTKGSFPFRKINYDKN